MRATFLLTALLGTCCLAAQGHWAESSFNDRYEYDVLKVEGIMMDALEAALFECQASRFKLCAFGTVTLIHHDHKYMDDEKNELRHTDKARAVVQSIDDLPVLASKQFAVTATRDYKHKASPLDTLSVRGEALRKAVQQCYDADQTFCVIVSIDNVATDKPANDPGTGKMIYQQVSKALVQGYTLKSSK